MKRILITVAIVAVLLTVTGYVSSPTTRHNATLATAGETIVLTFDEYPVQVTAYVKVNTGTVSVAGFAAGSRVVPNDASGGTFTIVPDSVMTVNEGDIIPITGKFTDIYWRGVGLPADATIYIYKE